MGGEMRWDDEFSLTRSHPLSGRVREAILARTSHEAIRRDLLWAGLTALRSNFTWAVYTHTALWEIPRAPCQPGPRSAPAGRSVRSAG
jgi:hypothetical protein